MRKFNILLADDEEPALLGLEEGIDWEKMNIEKIFKCHGKDTAIRMLQTYPIDILITDIEMPNGNGIELIKWVKEYKPQVLAVFYTGHAEFMYAREALRLGVEDYLLKPIPYRELEEIIVRMEKKILLLEKSVDLSELAGECTDEDAEKIVYQVKNLIAENLSCSNLQRDELAMLVHISPGYLGRIFKREEGIALSDYITQMRITVAKQLLRKTNIPITAISSRVGINYSSYFTKIFREHMGMTPQEYRKLEK